MPLFTGMRERSMGPFRVKIERPSIQYTCVVLVSFRFVSETTKTLANGTLAK